MQPTRNELPAGRVLTITADAASTGSVRRLAPSGSATQYAAASIAASSTTAIGPFGTDRNYEILSATGELTYAFSDGEATATSAGLASSLSDETGTGAAVFANTPTLITPVLGAATGTSLTATAGITSTGATGAGIGYATGAGGAVTQLTDATTGVTLNKLAGQITTVALDQAAGVDFSFTLTNSTIAAGDVVVASIKSYAGTADGIPVVAVVATTAGSCVLNVRNTGAVTLDALAVINFAVIKAVAA